ncbi:hypothetical protein [Marinomonas sp.]
MKLIILLPFAILLAACVGNTTPLSTASSLVPLSKWRTGDFRLAGENTGLLVITRDSGLRGSSCIPMIVVDRTQIAPLNIGERLELHVTAGPHLIGALPNTNCAANAVESQITIEQAQVNSFRFGFIDRSMVFTVVSH